MTEYITSKAGHYTPAASLAALGVKLQQVKLFEPIERWVHIAQKTVKHSPGEPKAAMDTKGYSANQRNRRGRQLGRVVASRYDEVVVDRLFDGKTQLTKALQPLLLAAEQTLDLDEGKRRRTIARVDAGGGSLVLLW